MDNILIIVFVSLVALSLFGASVLVRDFVDKRECELESNVYDCERLVIWIATSAQKGGEL